MEKIWEWGVLRTLWVLVATNFTNLRIPPIHVLTKFYAIPELVEFVKPACR